MPLSPAESRLHAALSEYLELVRSGGSGSSALRSPAPAGVQGEGGSDPAWTERLKSVSQNLDSLSAELASRVDPRLAHFLESKSYRKAYEVLSALSSAGLANSATPRQACSQ